MGPKHRVDTKWPETSPSNLRPFSSVQSLSQVRLFATPWIAARQTSLSITNSQSSLKLTSIESVMPSSHFILCSPLFLLPPITPSIRVFSSCKPSFLLMLFVLSCKTWNVVKPEAWLARPPSGAQPSQNSSPLLSASLALTAGSHSRSLTDQAVSWQFGSQVRGLLRFVSEA